MKTFDSSVQTTLDARRIMTRDMILFDLGTEGVFGFWSDVGTLTWNSIDFVGAGSLIELSEVTQTTGVEASEMTVKLRSVENTDLTPDMLGSLEEYAYFNKPFRHYVGFFNPDTGALLDVVTAFRGYIGQVTHVEDDKGVHATATIAGKSLDHSRTGYRKRSDADQKVLDNTDTGFAHSAFVKAKKIGWGVNWSKASTSA